MFRLSILCLFLVVTVGSLLAQNGSVQGTVLDPSGAAVPNAHITWTSAMSGTVRSTSTDDRGRYRLTGLPLVSFTMTFEAPGFHLASWTGDLRSNVPVIHEIKFSTEGANPSITVQGAPLLDVGSSSTHHDVDDDFMDRMPPSPPNQAMSAVVESVPGVVPEENGRIHVRGSEAQPQYIIDGVPLPENLGGAVNTALDTENLHTAEMITGNVPAEFGDKVAAVVNMSSKSGLDQPWNGSLSLSGGSLQSRAIDTEIGGHIGRLGIFGSADVSRSNRFIDPPEIDNFHNHGGLAHLFTRFDWLQSERDSIRLLLSVNGTNFQVPNTIENQDAGQDQRQELRDDLEAMAWTHTFNPKTLLDVNVSRRAASGRLLDPNQTGFPFYADQYRRQHTEGTRGKLSREWRFGNFEAGGEAYRYSLDERIRLALTDTEEVDPESPLLDYTLQDPFHYQASGTGTRSAVFVLNRFQFFDRLSVDVGLRFDHYRIVTEENGVSPRIGVAYYLKRTNTVFRAAYNRLFQTPPIENLLLSSSAQAAELTAEQDSPVRAVPVERQNFYEVGIQQQFGGHLRIDVARYTKNIHNFSDDQQLLATGIVFPVAIARADIRGTEVRLDLVALRGFTAYASYANARATITTPITGGLFLGMDAEDAKLLDAGVKLAADQDERNEVQFGSTYFHKSGFWMTFGGRFDSGLPTALQDGEYATLPPQIQSQIDPIRQRTQPRTLLNVVSGFDLMKESSHPLSLQVGVNNLTDRLYLYNFHSAFSGTHIGRPRELVVRLSMGWTRAMRKHSSRSDMD
jgi:outer membrane receptor protein involved in Fe transport